MRNYPLNCWYVAATSDELGDGLLARRLLDRPVVLYRRRTGEVVAFEDRCPHRSYPLSEGWRDGDQLVCAYHGFAYDPHGTCVRVPSQQNVPPGIRATPFPVREEPPLVWIWLGQPGAASLRTPPLLPWLGDEGWATTAEMMHVDANYMLLHEHYLDLTHMFVVHPDAMPPGLTTLPPLDRVQVSETSVSYSRVLQPAGLPEWEAEATGLSREATYPRREHGTFVSPAVHVTRYEIDAGADRTYQSVRVQALTPETAATTHLFWHWSRNYATDREVIGEHLHKMFGAITRKDIALLEKIQAGRSQPVARAGQMNVKADRAALKARRIVNVMLAEEAGRAAVRPSFST